MVYFFLRGSVVYRLILWRHTNSHYKRIIHLYFLIYCWQLFRCWKRRFEVVVGLCLLEAYQFGLIGLNSFWKVIIGAWNSCNRECFGIVVIQMRFFRDVDWSLLIMTLIIQLLIIKLIQHFTCCFVALSFSSCSWSRIASLNSCRSFRKVYSTWVYLLNWFVTHGWCECLLVIVYKVSGVSFMIFIDLKLFWDVSVLILYLLYSINTF